MSWSPGAGISQVTMTVGGLILQADDRHRRSERTGGSDGQTSATGRWAIQNDEPRITDECNGEQRGGGNVEEMRFWTEGKHDKAPPPCPHQFKVKHRKTKQTKPECFGATPWAAQQEAGQETGNAGGTFKRSERQKSKAPSHCTHGPWGAAVPTEDPGGRTESKQLGE